MLHDHARRAVERVHGAVRRVRVDDVVVRELLALGLRRVRDRARARERGAVERRPLMGVLAVAQRLRELPAHQQRIGPGIGRAAVRA